MTTGMPWLDATVSVLPSIVMLTFSPSLPPSPPPLSLSLSLSLSPLPLTLSLRPLAFSPSPSSFLYPFLFSINALPTNIYNLLMLPIHAYF